MNVKQVVLMLVIASSIGCGGKGSESRVQGTVKYKGKPLINGYVLLQFDDGNSANGDISTDGTYVVYTAFTGHAKVAVGSPKPAPMAKDDRGAKSMDPSKIPDPSKWFEIPAKYADPNTSGKDATIKSGTTTVDIELE